MTHTIETKAKAGQRIYTAVPKLDEHYENYYFFKPRRETVNRMDIVFHASGEMCIFYTTRYKQYWEREVFTTKGEAQAFCDRKNGLCI